MDLTSLIGLIPDRWLPYVTAAVTICGLVAVLLPPPDDQSSRIYRRLYAVINAVALNIGHARNAGVPRK